MAVPTFIQLFVLKRLISLNPNCTSDVDLSSLAIDESYVHNAKNILNSLAETNIFDFMKTKYNHDNVNVISLLFNTLIAKYPNEYNLIVSFENNCIGINNNNKENNGNNSNINTVTQVRQVREQQQRYYESKLFNQADLIPKVFQFLGFIDINKCCLVNSIWLYHGYNINSIYYFSIDNDSVLKDGKEERKRFLQRLINVRRLSYYDYGSKESFIIDEIKILQNIEYINIGFAKYDNNEKKLMKIINKNSEKFKRFACGFLSNVVNGDKGSQTKLDLDVPVFNLYNCQEIMLKGILFDVIFTNKCDKFMLNNLTDITRQWCKNIIDNCDFSNVKQLSLNNISFVNTMNNLEKQEIIGKFTSKCKNLHQLTIQNPNDDMLSIWKELIPVVKKNKVSVELLMHNVEELEERQLDDKFFEFLKNNKCSVNLLWLAIYQDTFGFNKHLLSIENVRSTVEHLLIVIRGESIVKLFVESLQLSISVSDNVDSSIVDHNKQDDNKGVDDEKDNKRNKDNKDNKDNINNMNNKDGSNSAGNEIHGDFNKLEALLLCSSTLITVNAAIDVLAAQFNITQNICFVSVDAGIKYTTDNKNFQKDCKKLFHVIENMIQHQMPLSININFKTKFQSKKDKNGKQNSIEMVLNSIYKDEFLPIFSKYTPKLMAADSTTNTQEKSTDRDVARINSNVPVSRDYKYPKHNKYCQSLDIPKFEFTITDDNNNSRLARADANLYYRWHQFSLATLKIQTAIATSHRE